jgi:hypothetical protein
MKIPFAATVLVLSCAAAAPASDVLGLSIRVGASYPMDSDTRDYANDVGYNAGARLELPLPTLLGTNSAIDLEGFEARDGSDRVNYLGLTYLEELKFSAIGVVVPYLGVGAGAYRVGLSTTQAVSAVSNVEVHDSAIRFGGRAMVGVELPLGLFVEASAVIIGKFTGVSPSTVNLAVGLRF